MGVCRVRDNAVRVILITGDQLRHKWVAWELARTTDWALSVFCDPARPNTPAQNVTELKLLEPAFYEPPLPRAWPGQPDLVLLYGCKIIPTAQFTCPVINLHLGLSPYYRGSGTNFWALHNGEPEAVGATIHIATNQVDGGPILAQVRPGTLAPEDGIHEVGIKALMAAVRVLPDVVHRPAQPQDLAIGRVYKRKDYTEEARRQAEWRLEQGMIASYLKHKAKRDARYPIVQAGTHAPA